MTGLWFVSYVVLWVLVVMLGFVIVGLLGQTSLLKRQFGQQQPASHPIAETSAPPLEHDGPSIGSRLPDVVAETVNDFGVVSLPIERRQVATLLMFMSAMCESCQHITDALNLLARDNGRAVWPIAILRADEPACRAFISIFPLHLPTICDSQRTLTVQFDVHRTPFGLLYDEHGTLIRKGIVMGNDDLKALLGDVSALDTAQDHVFPHPQLASS